MIPGVGNIISGIAAAHDAYDAYTAYKTCLAGGS
jgi:hypothetical protein